MAREVKSAINEFVLTKLVNMVKELLDDIPRASLHNTWSSIRLVYYAVVEQITRELLRKNVIEETVDAHIAKYFHTETAASGCQKGY